MNTLGYEKLRSAVKIIPEEWVRRGTASGKLPWQQVEKVGSFGTADQTEPAPCKTETSFRSHAGQSGHCSTFWPYGLSAAPFSILLTVSEGGYIAAPSQNFTTLVRPTTKRAGS